jgi:hypothetical protein
MVKAHVRSLTPALGLLLAGCAGPATGSGELTGKASIAITNAPPDGTCLQITVTGFRTVTRSFDLAAGASTVFELGGLPVGSDTFTASAFGQACSTVTAASVPNWVSDPVVQTVTVTADVSVPLTMHRNGRASVSVDFPNEPDGGGDATTCAPPLQLCGGVCVNLATDNANCGSCGHACPVLAPPSGGSTCGARGMSGVCVGEVGGFVQTSGSAISPNPDGQTVIAVAAPMPAIAGNLVGIEGVVGSNDTTPGDTTQMVYALYSDNAGKPGTLLFNTVVPDTSLTFSDPSAPVPVESVGPSGTFSNGFNDALSASTTYWVYMKAGTHGSTSDIAAPSSSPCAAASWVNVVPPGSFSAQPQRMTACNAALYMVVTFP